MNASLSFSQVAQVQCPECGTPLAAEVWLIIDASEHPDLIERCRLGNIHDLLCQNGHTGMAKAPLLLRLPDPERVLFSPPDSTTEEQDAAMKLALTQRLQLAMSSAGPNQLLAGVEQVSRLFLPLVLAGKSDEDINILKSLLTSLSRSPRLSGLLLTMGLRGFSVERCG